MAGGEIPFTWKHNFMMKSVPFLRHQNPHLHQTRHRPLYFLVEVDNLDRHDCPHPPWKNIIAIWFIIFGYIMTGGGRDEDTKSTSHISLVMWDVLIKSTCIRQIMKVTQYLANEGLMPPPPPRCQIHCIPLYLPQSFAVTTVPGSWFIGWSGRAAFLEKN